MVRAYRQDYQFSHDQMLRVNLADIDAGVRVLLSVPSAHREKTANTLCERADLADRFRRCTDKPHPMYGSGTLMSAAAAFANSGKDRRDEDAFLECLRVLVAALSVNNRDQRL